MISLEILPNATVPATAFSNLVANKTTTDREVPSPYMHEQLGIVGKGMIEEVSELKYSLVIYIILIDISSNV